MRHESSSLEPTGNSVLMVDGSVSWGNQLVSMPSYYHGVVFALPDSDPGPANPWQ